MKLILLVFLFFLPLFIFRYYSSQPQFKSGDTVRITARLSQQPLIFNNNQLLNTSGIRFFVPRFPEYYYGDRITVEGKVTENEYGLTIEDPQTKLIDKHGVLPEIRKRMIETINNSLPQPENSLVAGIALGSRENLTEEFRNSLVSSGTLHVVVASGTNITLLAKFFITILVVFFRRQIALPIAFILIWLYVFIIGPEAPIVRAALMGSLTFLAQESGRIYLAWWGLILSALVMLLINPLWIQDIGFLLSFAATTSILAFEKPIRNLISGKLRYFPAWFRDNFSTSLAAQAGVLPIIWFSFGQVSVWSPITNGLVLWTIPPIIILGFLGGIIGLIWEDMGRVIILLNFPLALYFTKIVILF